MYAVFPSLGNHLLHLCCFVLHLYPSLIILLDYDWRHPQLGRPISVVKSLPSLCLPSFLGHLVLDTEQLDLLLERSIPFGL